MDIYEFFLGYT